MMRFKRIVHHFRHFQLSGPMFVVGADCGRVKPALHTFFEESSRAKHLKHRRLRRCGGGRAGSPFRSAFGYRGVILEWHVLALGSLRRSLELCRRGIVRRIGYALCQKPAFTLARENLETSYDSIPLGFAPLDTFIGTSPLTRSDLLSLLIQSV